MRLFRVIRWRMYFLITRAFALLCLSMFTFSVSSPNRPAGKCSQVIARREAITVSANIWRHRALKAIVICKKFVRRRRVNTRDVPLVTFLKQIFIVSAHNSLSVEARRIDHVFPVVPVLNCSAHSPVVRCRTSV